MIRFTGGRFCLCFAIECLRVRVNVARKRPGCHARNMKCNQVMCTILGCVLSCCFTAAAQEKGYWRAASSTAQSITGDVTLSTDKIAINFASFPIAQIRGLEPGELSAVFEAEGGAGGGNLYRLSIPATKVFLHKNTLCGSEQTQWMATYVSGRMLHLAFFSGTKIPVLTPDGIANSTDLCGTFLYGR